MARWPVGLACCECGRVRNRGCSTTRHLAMIVRNEAIGYLWEGWINQFGKYSEKPSWCAFRPTSGTAEGC